MEYRLLEANRLSREEPWLPSGDVEYIPTGLFAKQETTTEVLEVKAD